MPSSPTTNASPTPRAASSCAVTNAEVSTSSLAAQMIARMISRTTKQNASALPGIGMRAPATGEKPYLPDDEVEDEGVVGGVVPEGVTILTNPDDAVLSVITPAALRVEAELGLPGEEAPEVAEEPLAEGEEAPAEGEEAPAAEEGGES